MARTTKIMQLRLPIDLYEAIDAEVQQRKAQGQMSSLNAVAVEWLTDAIDAHQHRQSTRER